MTKKGKGRTWRQDIMRGEWQCTTTPRSATKSITQQGGGGQMSSAPGGSKFPSSKIGEDGHFARGDLHSGVNPDDGTGTSIFDPVLCEIGYRWFSGPGMKVIDPFAGGSVRGIVAAMLAREYTGIELRSEQVAANALQAEDICKGIKPNWICDDSKNILAHVGHATQDLLLTCPPYGDLEVYSDDPRDISTMSYDAFRESYRDIVGKSVLTLKQDRFAMVVVGDFRGKEGFYRNFVSHTIEAFEAGGMKLYNEAILVTAVGSLPIRAGRPFLSSRKLGKTHQNILVFCKGDPKKAASDFGPVEIDEELLRATDE